MPSFLLVQEEEEGMFLQRGLQLGTVTHSKQVHRIIMMIIIIQQ